MKKYNIQATLLSSLIHTEETSSNIANIYREKVLRNGILYNIPAIHGNSIRGKLRNISAEHFLSTIGAELHSIPSNLFHILFSGGALEKSSIFVDVEQKRELRRLIPYLSIFGSAIGDEMLEGKLIISSALPRCKELENSNTSFYDLTQIIKYTRQDDRKLINGDKYLLEDNQASYQMFYEIETLCKGTQLDITIILKSDDLIEQGALENALTILQIQENYLGGKSAIGHGEIAFNFDRNQDAINAYHQHLTSNADAIKNYIFTRFK